MDSSTEPKRKRSRTSRASGDNVGMEMEMETADDEKKTETKDLDVAAVLAVLKAAPDRLLGESLTIDGLERVLDEYHSMWRPQAQQVDTEKLCKSAIERFNIRKTPESALLEPHELTQEKVEEAYKKELFRWVSLQQIFRFHSMLDTNLERTQAFAASKTATANANKFQDIIDAIVAARQLLLAAALAFHKLHVPFEASNTVANLDPFFYVPIKLRQTKLDDTVEIALFLLQELAKRSYMRKGKNLWEPIRVAQPKEQGGLDDGDKTVPSHAWKLVDRFKDISSFISEIIDKESHYSYWSALLARNCKAKVLEYLENDANDIEFHQLKPNRSLFSFRNGILNTADCRFYPFFVKDGSTWVPNSAIHSDWVSSNFFDADFNLAWPSLDLMKTMADEKLSDPNSIKQQYGFWVKSDDHEKTMFHSRWWGALLFMGKKTLQTPKFDAIISDQLSLDSKCTSKNPYWGSIKQRESIFSKSFRMLNSEQQAEYLAKHETNQIWKEEYFHLLFWHYALIGRLLFPVGKLDNWQIIQFFKGVAGTGKSTILNIITDFFAKGDVETMSNTGTRGGGKGVGGLTNFLDKALWKVAEVKGDFGLDQSTFQSMISGEVIAVDVLYKESISVKWEVPGLLAGNDFAGWRDNSGSIARRVVVTNFGVPLDPSKKDPTLEAQIKAEIPAILYKSLLCYRIVAWLHVKKDIWNILPRYFWWTRSKLASFTDPLSNFLEQQLEEHEYDIIEKVKGKESEAEKAANAKVDFVMTWEQFCKDFMAWADVNEIPRKRIVEYKMDIEKAKSAFMDRGVLVEKVDTPAAAKAMGTRLFAQVPSVPVPSSASYYVLVGITKKSRPVSAGDGEDAS